jgi:hypothetical protein
LLPPARRTDAQRTGRHARRLLAGTLLRRTKSTANSVHLQFTVLRPTRVEAQ